MLVCSKKEDMTSLTNITYQDKVNEEKSVKNIQDSGEYLGHFCPKLGTGPGVGKGVLEHLAKYETNLNQLSVVMTDGTSKMTGWKTGAMASIEQDLGRPLQRGVCLNHHIKKPFEHVYVHYDGPINGPSAYSGPIGQAMVKDVWKDNITDFEPLENTELLNMIKELPEEVCDEFGADHRYMLEMAKAVLEGKIEDRWERAKAGKCHNASWITRQARILRSYMSTPNPTFEMKRLVWYLIYVYVPTLLKIRHHGLFEDGTNNLLYEIKCVSKYCNDVEKDIVQRIIQVNGYFGHQENILISLLCSPSLSNRATGVSHIQRIRRLKKQKWPKICHGVRPFKVPALNFNAESISELSNLDDCVTEPPITMNLSDQDVLDLFEKPLNLGGVPCTTTACERAVQLTSSAVQVSADPDMQDASNFSKISSRKRNKDARNKKWNV